MICSLYHYILTIVYSFVIFCVFWHLCVSTRSSVGFQKIFFDKPSETCQTLSSSEELPARARKKQNSKNTQFVHYICTFRPFMHEFVMFFGFWHLCVSTRSSVGFQQFFFDKPSETCQILSSSEEFSAWASKSKIIEIHTIRALYQYILTICA